MLEGKRILITGVSTQASIGFAVAREVQLAGGEVVLTSFGRMRRITERSARSLPDPVDVLELDVNRPEDFDALTADLETRWGTIDGAVHAIAFAPLDAIGGGFLDTPPDSATIAFQTSAVSLKSLARALLPLFPSRGGAIVGLDFDATVAWPAYDWMGVAKAALESVNRYLARDLGPAGIRVNLVAAGPLRTMAASAIPGFSDLVELWRMRSPLAWDPDDAEPVAKVVALLLSDWTRAVTGEIVHVDGGAHAMGAEPDALAIAARAREALADAEPASEATAHA
jgi:enoyl-[acyl-carrier protein] reductase I